MEYKTYGELKLKVQQETDTETEDFVSEAELLRWFNDAINECEANIHLCGLEEDYFLTRDVKSLTLGQETVDLPTNIYANKIRAVLYHGQSDNYKIDRIRGRRKFEEANYLKEEYTAGASMCYQYMIYNDSASVKPYMELFPKSNETTADCIRIYYIRNANAVVDDSSLVDIPEFHYYITAYVRFRIYDKEGSVQAAAAEKDLNKAKQLMMDTLATMVPDDDDEIDMDLTIYEEME